MEINLARQDYMKNPSLVENFKKNYLATLNVFLHDDKFTEKINSLPVLQSSSIVKLEKAIEKEKQDKAKKKKFRQVNVEQSHIHDDKQENKYDARSRMIKSMQSECKPISVRYIILDTETKELNLSNIEETFFHSKLANPIKTYFHESNPKLVRRALETIISDIMPKSSQRSKASSSVSPSLSNTRANFSNKQGDEYNLLLEKYSSVLSSNNLNDAKTKENFENFLKFFNECCEINNLITVNQKIDYFVLLKSNHLMQMKSENESLNKSQSKAAPTMKRNKFKIDINSNNVTNTNFEGKSLIKSSANFQSSRNITRTHTIKTNFHKSKTGVIDVYSRFISDLKAKFNINYEQPLREWEEYYNDLQIKIGSYKLFTKNLDNSNNIIDRIKLFLNCAEISSKSFILRDCDLDPERIYNLINMKLLDFRSLSVINVSKNNLCDIGVGYLLYLLDLHGGSISYLNIAYNKIGRQSVELLTNILHKNKVAIESLNISGNNIGDQNFSDLCLGISKSLYLEKLFSSDNNLGKISSIIIGTILKYDKKLKLIDLSKNNLNDDVIGNLLKGLICNTHLYTLMLNENGLTNKSLRNFETTLSINSTLKRLFLERNKFASKGCLVLSEIFHKNKHLEYVSLIGNSFDLESIDYIIDRQRQIPLKVITKSDYMHTILTTDEKNLYEYF